MTTTFKHPSLGVITGTAKDGITQFLGIKYASLETRLSASRVFARSNDVESIDATSFGAAVRGSPGACEFEFGLIQQSLPKSEVQVSELHGLNLNITVSKFDVSTVNKEGTLPVFVFIHGGNFQGGSSEYPQYDQTEILRLSSKISLPVIGVSLNYRLGLSGFLTSEELRRAGFPANNGLRDQINGLLWIRDNIGAFGGDKGNITVIGESAGAVSASLLLNATEPLFRRLVLMSGTSLTLHPISEADAEAAYGMLISTLGLNDLDESDRLAALLTMAPEDLYTHASNLLIKPSIDGYLVPDPKLLRKSITNLTEGQKELPENHWCEELLIGDCQFDASVFSSTLSTRLKGICPLFVQSLSTTIAPLAVAELLGAYDITDSCTNEEALHAILKLATDIEFFAPIFTFVRGFPGNKYVYHFNEVNPWQGKWTGSSTHVLDLAYLLQNFNQFLSTPQRRIAISFATDVVQFINGIPPWPAFTDESNGAQIYGPSGAQDDEKCIRYALHGSEKNTGRKMTIFEFSDTIGSYELSRAWNRFLQGI